MTFEQQQAELMQMRSRDLDDRTKKFLQDTHPISVIIGYEHYVKTYPGYHRWSKYPGFSTTSYPAEPNKIYLIVCCENIYDAVLWKLRWGEP